MKRNRKPRKGDRVVYTGPYEPSVTAFYGVGVVIGFRNYGETVTVQFDNGLYAYWPIEQTALES